MVDGWSWVFVVAALLAVAAGAGIGVLAWRRRNVDRALGVLFVILAVASTINITLIGHRMKVFEQNVDRRLACLEARPGEQPMCSTSACPNPPDICIQDASPNSPN